MEIWYLTIFNPKAQPGFQAYVALLTVTCHRCLLNRLKSIFSSIQINIPFIAVLFRSQMPGMKAAWTSYLQHLRQSLMIRKNSPRLSL